jgi:hypothetical protein
MDIIRLYEDYSIPIAEQGNKHCTPGWINTHCPFCEGTQNYHLGYNMHYNYFTCYRCGFHWIPITISKLLEISETEAKKILKQYGNTISHKESIVKIGTKPFKLPSNSLSLQINHKKYLENRGFDPEKLEREFGLLGTGPISRIKDKNYNIDYRFRIIIPFYWEDKIVSFDSRDITNQHIAKYMACPKDREIIPHKSILYMSRFLPQEQFKTAICVEGPSDVWRMGRSSFATSGIGFTTDQVHIISKMSFKRVAVIFDGPSETSKELEAHNKASILIGELKFRGIDAFRIKIKGDPGSMKQEDADYLVKQILT